MKQRKFLKCQTAKLPTRAEMECTYSKLGHASELPNFFNYNNL